MNKLLTSIFAAMMLISASACAETIYASKNIVTKNVTTGSFSGISTTSSVDVEYIQSPAQSIVISAPDNIIDYVEVKVSGKTLKVGYKSPCNIVLHKSKVVVKVSAPNVSSFTTGSSGDIDIKGTLDIAGDVTFNTGSSGDIEAKSVKCKRLNATTSSSGDIEIDNAYCITLMAKTQSSGDIKIKNVSATTVNATTQSSGDIKLAGTCTDAKYTTGSSGDINAKSLRAVNVIATTNSSGDIYFNGKHAETRKSSSGDIHRSKN